MEKHLKISNIVFRSDTVLNLAIGLVLIFADVDSILMLNPPVIAGWVYRVLGILYIGFAVWQMINIKNTTAPATLRFAFWMVILPALFMGWALISFHTELKANMRIILWIAELYMILLSGWYGYLYQEQQAA